MSIPVLSGIGDFINSFNQPSPPPPKVIGDPSQMKLTVNNPTPVPQPAQTTATPTTDNTNFKFRMGSSDYSDIAPQVQSALKGTPLEAYGNDFIQAGNKHGVDPRALVTISNNESSRGLNYPTDSYNPFGYKVNGSLEGAGFTSLPMAIDRLTQRFSNHPFNPTPASYQTFSKQPTIENLQAAYNATPSEQANWIKNGHALASQFFK